MFIKELSELNDPDLTVEYLPSNTETFISFSIKYKVGVYHSKNGKPINKCFELRFLDSLRFMNSSLDNLTKNLTSHPHLDHHIEDYRLSRLLKHKGIIPYEYLDNFDKLSETSLPPINKFYSSLKLESISQKDYIHATNVFNRYQNHTIYDYLMLYLKTDVIHLTDVFEELRKTCLKYYKLDPLWFYTAPSLSWNAMLYKTKVKLELVSDSTVLEFFEQQMRGGFSIVFDRYAEANNRYLPNYDESKPSSYIPSLDANNLYGWAMSKPFHQVISRFREQ